MNPLFRVLSVSASQQQRCRCILKRSVNQQHSAIQSDNIISTTIGRTFGAKRFFATHDNKNNENNNRNINMRNNIKEQDAVVFERTVYVHPLSQIILEYLQEAHHDWIVAQQLDAALTLHRDGSFELKLKEDNDDNEGLVFGDDTDNNTHRIWTAYDEREKKHWLTVYRGPNVPRERFLLQDNLLPAWNLHRKSLPERIHLQVDEMIRRISERKSE